MGPPPEGDLRIQVPLRSACSMVPVSWARSTTTIDGRVEFTVTRGAVSVDRLDLATAEVMHGNDDVVIGPPVIIARDRELCR